MPPVLTESQCRHLRMIFERGAAAASQALSKWLGEEVSLSISEVEQVDLAEAAGVLGPAEALVAACAMVLSGPLGGQMLLVFEDRAGLALADLLLRQPPGTTTTWGEIERSAAMETTNIVGCAYLNALAAHLPGGLAKGEGGDADELVPSPPTFLHEFAGSLLEFALMDQALELDRVLLVHSAFSAGRRDLSLDWTLLFIPDHASLRALAGAIGELESH
ncbi:chemotaxis protein CheC [Aquisphaera insulae]|uniref:chemotaxis protein CheC n=1 Tax=Aquisphaera insulae TaxID=2712864 RepID=UPI0013EE018F|nr:chemotaxis protein CheC [Aquisphaera insulae]